MHDIRTRVIDNLKREDGFTVVELLIVSALTVVVLVAVYNIFVSGMNQYEMVSNQNQAVRDAGQNLDIMARYLRETEGIKGPLQSGDPGDYAVSTRVDLGNDGQYDNITFALDEATRELKTTFQYADGTTRTEVYATDVQNEAQSPPEPIFRYYNVSSVEITNAASRASRAASMQIRLVIDADTAKLPAAVDVSTLVTLRNSQT